jgi:hypothetical protein
MYSPSITLSVTGSVAVCGRSGAVERRGGGTGGFTAPIDIVGASLNAGPSSAACGFSRASRSALASSVADA